MENLYGYVFWYNSYEGAWYAIETKNYTEFMSGHFDRTTTLKSSKIDTLIDLITKDATVEE